MMQLMRLAPKTIGRPRQNTHQPAQPIIPIALREKRPMPTIMLDDKKPHQ